LDSSVEEGIRLLRQEVLRQAKIKKIESGIWKGKRIVTIEKWEKLKKKFKDKEILQFIPEIYLDRPFGFNEYSSIKDEEFHNWSKIWFEYLKSKKDSKFGAELCGGCILYQDLDHPNSHNPSNSTSIRDIILKHPKAKGAKLGCPIDIFQCPYNQFEDDFLFELRYIWKIVHDALSEAHRRSTYNHSKFIEIDFEHGFAFSYHHWSSQPHKEPIEITLNSHKLSIIPIKTIKDIYNVLTTPKLLKAILEQYNNYVMDEPKGNTDEHDDDEDKDTKELKQWMPKIIQFFKEIKDKINLEEMCDLTNHTMRDEEEEKKRAEQIHTSLLQREPEYANYFKKQLSDNCVVCSKFSNIHCLNCGNWICDEHWREHGQTMHNYVSKKNKT